MKVSDYKPDPQHRSYVDDHVVGNVTYFVHATLIYEWTPVACKATIGSRGVQTFDIFAWRLTEVRDLLIGDEETSFGRDVDADLWPDAHIPAIILAQIYDAESSLCPADDF